MFTRAVGLTYAEANPYAIWELTFNNASSLVRGTAEKALVWWSGAATDLGVWGSTVDCTYTKETARHNEMVLAA